MSIYMCVYTNKKIMSEIRVRKREFLINGVFDLFLIKAIVNATGKTRRIYHVWIFFSRVKFAYDGAVKERERERSYLDETHT